MKEVKSFLPLLHSMKQCRGNNERNILMSHMDDPSFDFLCKWMGKTISSPSLLNLSSARTKKLKSMLERDKRNIKYITRGGHGTNKRKRKLVRQSGEGIGLLVGILAPILVNLVTDLIKKARNKKK